MLLCFRNRLRIVKTSVINSKPIIISRSAIAMTVATSVFQADERLTKAWLPS